MSKSIYIFKSIKDLEYDNVNLKVGIVKTKKDMDNITFYVHFKIAADVKAVRVEERITLRKEHCKLIQSLQAA